MGSTILRRAGAEKNAAAAAAATEGILRCCWSRTARWASHRADGWRTAAVTAWCPCDTNSLATGSSKETRYPLRLDDVRTDNDRLLLRLEGTVAEISLEKGSHPEPWGSSRRLWLEQAETVFTLGVGLLSTVSSSQRCGLCFCLVSSVVSAGS